MFPPCLRPRHAGRRGAAVALDALGGHGAGVPRVFRIHGRKREKPTYLYIYKHIYILWNIMEINYIYYEIYIYVYTMKYNGVNGNQQLVYRQWPHRMATEVLRCWTCTKNSPMVLGLGCPNFDPNSVVLGHPGWHTHIYISHYIHYIIYYMCIYDIWYIYIYICIYIYISWILNLIQELFF